MPILNIGENAQVPGGAKYILDERKILAALHIAGALPTDVSGYEGDTEYTYVLTIPRELSEREVRDLAIVLDQEAIAYWRPGRAFLAGPKADKWGPFDPTLFVLPNGEYLADHFTQAA